MNWRKLNRVLHRDFGYFFTATTIIYALSGIALNHMNDWNPNYVVNNVDFQLTEIPPQQNHISEDWVLDLVDRYDERDNVKKFYFPKENRLKVFLHGGSIVVDLDSGFGFVETIRRRKLFYEANYLHYNPGKWWTWFSDIYAGALALLAITGLFILKGKNGITGRGAWLTAAGIIAPLALLYLII
ncbi:MAG: PepSY-associated TM helix domain-containing protein [Bacteroidota bacterium]|nr:PepSY-associated TM helix domain-containing protein [Bacteroidota bacterium]